MRQTNIQSKVAKKFVITTESKHSMKPAPDRLKRCFRTEEQNVSWVSDTTFIPTRQGWLFLAVILDLYSRQVIRWAMSNRNDRQLVSDALTMAIRLFCPTRADGVQFDTRQFFLPGQSAFDGIILQLKIPCPQIQFIDTPL